MSDRAIPSLLLSACALAAPAAGAQTIQQWDGVQANSRLGSAVDALPDLDGDGVEDVAIGIPFATGGSYQAGEVALYSGRTGALLWVLGDAAALDHSGWSVAGVADLDGDGRGEVLVGAPDADGGGNASGRARVYSGGAVLFEWNGAMPFDGLGGRVAAAGDPSGDGVVDLLLGASRAAGLAGRADLRSGADGALLASHVGLAPEDRLGCSLAGLGDVDGDGRDDYALGAIQEGYGPGYVRVISGASGGLLRLHTGQALFENFGEALAGLGDVNGDGRADYAVGATFAQVGVTSRGRVDVFSGLDGARLWSRHGLGDLERFGGALDSGLDVDGDGLCDLLVGAQFGAGWRGRAVLLSGADGTTLRQWIGSALSDRFGWAVALCGDLDGDGGPDALIGAPREDLAAADAGTARALSGSAGCAPFTYCTSKPNSLGCEPGMGWSGSPALAGPGDFRVETRGLLAGSAGTFLFSLQSATQPLLAGTLCVAPPLARGAPVASDGPPGPCAGRLSLAMPPTFMSAQGWNAGTTVHVQAWSRDPAHPDGTGSSSSNGLAFVVCP